MIDIRVMLRINYKHNDELRNTYKCGQVYGYKMLAL